MLSAGWDTVRLSLHVFGATIWVGGQVVLAGLVPTLRRLGPDAPRVAARRFGLVAWPAYGLLVGTGIWNVVAAHDDVHGRYAATLTVKLVLVALSGVAALLHTKSRTRAGLAVFGALALVTALAAMVLGVVLAG
jgi:putative copper export protein